MDPIQRLLKTIRGVSKANPVTYIQLSEMIRTLWKTDSSGSDPDTITETTENTTVNGKHTHKLELPVVQITEIVKTIQSNNHESYLIENTVNESETVESSWSVLPYTEQVGEFKAVVMVRNKSLDTIITLMNILSFDYSDAVKVVQQNPMLTNAEITLAVGVNEANKLYATVSGMTADAKRIHLCFERCVLSQRSFDMNASVEFVMEMAATMTAFLNLSVTADLSLSFGATPSAYRKLAATLDASLGMNANPSAYRQMSAANDVNLNVSAFPSVYRQLPAALNMNLGLLSILTLEASGTPVDFALFYNLPAVNDVRELAPADWRIANIDDWLDVINFYGGEVLAGGDLKALIAWLAPNTGATNTHGFSALPAGQRNELGEYSEKLTKSLFWIK